MLVEDGRLLIVQQQVAPQRAWSLPGGRVELGETLEAAMIREMGEETGLATRILRLLYVCDTNAANPPLLHVTFLLERAGGRLR